MPYTTLQLITAVRSQFGEDTAATSAVTDVQILEFLNQSQRDLCAAGNLLLTCATTATVAGQEEYPIPSDYLKICLVTIYRTDGLKLALKPISLQQRDPARTQSANQRYYYVWGVNSGGLNRYHIGLTHDVPSTTSLVDDLEIHYRQQAAPMISGGTPPEVPEQFQDALIEGALTKIYNRLAPRDPAKWLPLYDRKLAIWKDWKLEARRYVNPLLFDQPKQIIDTAGYLREYTIT